MAVAAPARTQGLAADLAQLVDPRDVDAPTLDAMLQLFDGHDVPAVYWARGRKRGFYKSPNLQRRVAFKAHMLGVILAGSYPFRGVLFRCGCVRDKHTCDGAGTNYICLDLDAHDGETDTPQRVTAVLAVCHRLRLFPLTVTSKSGRGAHVFLFLNRRVTTAVANSAGRAIALAAGIRDRCDVIPSAGHAKGFGTLHALPLSPLAEPGGGLVLDANLRPLQGVQATGALLWANAWRSDAGVVESLATPRSAAAARARTQPLQRLVAPPGTVLAGLLKHHPQFRRVLTMDPSEWKGKRSSRDAYLVGYLRRQGLPADEIAQILVTVPGSKTAERGIDYAIALVEAQEALTLPLGPPLAGQPAPGMNRQGPWSNRVAPPATYGERPNPWWGMEVQAQLRASRRSPADAVILAYLIDRYFRGPICRRMFFAGAREVGEALGFPTRTVANATKRIGEKFSGVIRVVPGVPHPKLRIAAAFYVVDETPKDCLDWEVCAGRSQE